jgi:ABC-type uncharacterized transport system involved in gliding motility auxiliary subunit
MNGDEREPQSFSVMRRFGAGLNLVVTVAAVLAIVAMVNYLGMRHFMRFKWTRGAGMELSARTKHVLSSLTNSVRVVTYFDSTDEFIFPRVRGILREYELASGGKVRVQHVDYLRDVALANKIKQEFKIQSTATRDMILFESGGRTRAVNAADLSDYDYSELMSGKSREVHRTHFKGELLFTSAIYGVAMQRSPKAYFLIGHGESDPRDTTGEGYSKFAMILQSENNFELALLDLTSQKEVPADCNLLIISGPRTVIDEEHADRIHRYLEKGGRLLLLFNFRQLPRPSGLEKVLATWGVEVGENVVADPENATNAEGTDPKPLNPGQHPIVNSLGSAQVHLFMPRSVRALKTSSPRRDEAKVDELLFTGPRTSLITKLAPRGSYTLQQGVGPQSLCVAVEKSIPAIERGSTRIVAIGDSTMWANTPIESNANSDFAAATVNWLVQQNLLLAEIPRQALRNSRLSMTRSELRAARWLLLGALPLAVLAVGTLVWARRRS